MSLALAFALLSAALAPAQDAPAYQPQGQDERGLWMQMDEEERRIRASNFVIRDAALNEYVRGVLCRTVGPRCREVRLYLMRTPYFNAAMAPNGMMHVWSGLFLRVRDEAQLAAVLDHEFTHYEEQHSLKIFRDIKNKTSTFSFLSVPLAIFTGGLGATAAQAALFASITGFSRDQELAADAGSVRMLAAAGYDPAAASRVWRQIREERDATAAMRRHKPRGEDAIFGSHPTTAERMATLAQLAQAQARPGAIDLGRERYRAALAPHWASFVDDQIKLNDFGGTELLLNELARDGWTADLLYAKGELYRARGYPADMGDAATAYRAAIAAGNAPAEAHRGLGLALLRKGNTAAGQAALRDYVKAKPDAKDGAMMAQLAGQGS